MYEKKLEDLEEKIKQFEIKLLAKGMTTEEIENAEKIINDLFEELISSLPDLEKI